MKTICILTLALGSSALARDDKDWRIDEKEAIQKAFSVSSGSGPHKLLVDIVGGYVHVTGHSGSEVRVTIDKHILADYREAVEEAKRDVKLDMSQQGNFVRLYEEGPYRNGNGINYRGDDYYGYRVRWNCDIEVPTDTEVIVKTVNRGEIVVKKVTGDYDIHGLNGGIEMDDVSGSGSVSTLNGKVSVTYTRNPQKPTRFRTLNGTIDVYFPKTLDADLHIKKLNGQIYTDFELTLLPTSGSSDSSNGRWVYRSNREVSARAGKGGPELSFETLNGTIRLHSK
jgi:hypothetical protein